MTSDRVFGAVARYTCEAGFVLSGPAERVCRADGEWSGMAPTCETEGGCCPITFTSHTTSCLFFYYMRVMNLIVYLYEVYQTRIKPSTGFRFVS